MGVSAQGQSDAAFSPRTVLALVAVGLLAAMSLVTLSAYAPDLRAMTDPGANALSSSAVGFRGAVVMLQAEGVPAEISRSVYWRGGLVLTPGQATPPGSLKRFTGARAILLVLPKWITVKDPTRPGYVLKTGVETTAAARLLTAFSPRNTLQVQNGVRRPVLHGTGEVFEPGTTLPLGPIDSPVTISGDAWAPMLVDDQGKAVLARSKTSPHLWVLADPDLLNTQGLAGLDTARAGMAILDAFRADAPLAFDVTLNGYQRGRGIVRLMLQPPWLAATLCGLAAGLLMGLHALGRFGPTRRRGRAFGLGAGALVDSAAGLVRMARKEALLAPAYLDLVEAQALGGRRLGAADPQAWLADRAERRGLAAPGALAAEGSKLKTRDETLDFARRVHDWKREIAREDR
jgi:hypothetical protein